MTQPNATSEPWSVRAYYAFSGDMSHLEIMDKAIFKAAGRPSDGSGCGLCEGLRDHEWYCNTKLEAYRMMRRIEKLGLRVQAGARL